MAMRNYGIEGIGMVLTYNELETLLKDNNIKYTEINDFVYEIRNATYFWEVVGALLKYDENMWFRNDIINYNYEDIIIIDLDKYTLFNSYKDLNEIYEELKEKFKEVGIIINDKFIEEHFGKYEGSYYG